MVPRHVDDGAPTFLHQLRGCPGCDDRPAQIDGQHEVELLPDRQAPTAPSEDVGASIVDPRVDAAEALLDFRGERLDFLVPADVAPPYLRAAPQMPDRPGR